MSEAYGFFAPGVSGTTDDFNVALKWLANNREWRPKGSKEGAIYIRLDLAADLPAEELRSLLDARQELPPPLRTGWPARPGEDQAEWEEPRVLLDRRSYFKVSLLDEDRRSGRSLNGVAGQMRRAFKPALGVPTDGTARRLAGRRRVAALKALGNAVVPACAKVLGEMINRFEEEQGR